MLVIGLYGTGANVTKKYSHDYYEIKHYDWMLQIT